MPFCRGITLETKKKGPKYTLRLSNKLQAKNTTDNLKSWIKRTKKKKVEKYSGPIVGKFLHSGKSGPQVLKYKGIGSLETAMELCSKDKGCKGITRKIMKSGKPKFTLRINDILQRNR